MTASPPPPEIFGNEVASRDALARRAALGKIRRITRGMYTTDLTNPLEDVVRRNLWHAVALAVPDALVADRTALEAQPAADGSVFVISQRKRPVTLPGIVIRPRPGPQRLASDMPLPGGIAMSSRARAFLENMRPLRRGAGTPRVLPRHQIEAMLERMLTASGEHAINALRDQIHAVAADLGMQRQAIELDRLIGALQGTQSAVLKTPQGKARAKGIGFDTERTKLFAKLHQHLRSQAPLVRRAPLPEDEQVLHLAFFEAYFSNFIEGTEFEIEEAAEIVYANSVPSHRSADAHDVAGTFRVVNDPSELRRVPRDGGDLIDLLQHRHRIVMGGRPDMGPGQFKTKPNRAGGTEFVAPSLVEGTLRAAFELYGSLETAFERATYLAFVVSEVHPFADGNGRIARIMMNAELVAADEWRILIPTVYRTNYLQALRALTHNSLTTPITRMLDFAQRYTSSLDYSDIRQCARLLTQTNALVDASQADLSGIRLQLPTPDMD